MDERFWSRVLGAVELRAWAIWYGRWLASCEPSRRFRGRDGAEGEDLLG